MDKKIFSSTFSSFFAAKVVRFPHGRQQCTWRKICHKTIFHPKETASLSNLWVWVFWEVCTVLLHSQSLQTLLLPNHSPEFPCASRYESGGWQELWCEEQKSQGMLYKEVGEGRRWYKEDEGRRILAVEGASETHLQDVYFTLRLLYLCLFSGQ